MDTEKMDEQVEEEVFGTDADPLEKEDSDNASLADATLEEISDESAEESENRPTVGAIAKLREQRREAQEETHQAQIVAAELRGRLAAQEERLTQKAVEQELSPFEVAMKEQEVNNLDDLDISPGESLKLGRQQAKWEAAQEAKKSAETAKTIRDNELAGLFKAEQAKDRGEGLDYDTIIKMGMPLLSKGDEVDIENSPNLYEAGYRLCVRAIQERGDEATKKILQENLARKKTKHAGSDPPKKEGGNTDEDETDNDEDEPIVNPNLRHLVEGIFSG